MANWSVVKSKADEIRKKYLGDKPPVNVFDIASKEGIDIIYFVPNEKTKDISGLLDASKKAVYLNAYDSAPRQNFTLAHELAHYFLKHKPDEYGVYRRNSLYLTAKPDKEQEADLFAAELLMPNYLVRKAQKEYGLTDDDTSALAQLFGVSPSAMKYRLKSLKHERARD